jgi:segregation and condensation protein B
MLASIAEDEEELTFMLGSVSPRGPLARRLTNLPPENRLLPSIYRILGVDNSQFIAAGPFARDEKLALVEAALLAADEPLTARRLALVTGLDDAALVRRLLSKLQTLYDEEGSAFQIHEIAGGFQLLTRPEYHPWLLRLRQSGHDLRLSPAARETLAIVAYRQPIMRADIEAVRGVQCGDVLRLLMEKGLVRIAGRHDSLGRPVLYGTTKKFLQVFGLRSLKDLPHQQVQGASPGGDGQTITGHLKAD